MSRRRTVPKSRHVRKPPRVCLLRVTHNGQQIGAVGQLDPTGVIVSSSLATITGDPQTYWRRLRALLPASAIVMASPILRSGRSEVQDLEMSIWRRIRAAGTIGPPSARGLRLLRTARARATRRHRAECYARRASRPGVQWAFGCKPKLAQVAA